MVDKIDKEIDKYTQKERAVVKAILNQIKTGQLNNLDVVKLKNQNNIYRVRKGRVRIIFQKLENKTKILAVERRSDTTYNL
ncbi:MAG: hypothetical protein ABIH21_02370 [Patescibacteria group bacterium]